MKNNLKRELVYIISYRELFNLAEQVYDVPVELDAVSNDTSYYINNVNYQIKPEERTETLNTINNDLILVKPSSGERVRMDIGQWDFSTLIQDLVNLQMLHPGSYVIEVMW